MNKQFYSIILHLIIFLLVNTTMAYWTFFGDNYETYQISYGCPLVNGNEIGRKKINIKIKN